MRREGLQSALAADLLSEGWTVRLPVAGSSMKPLLRPGATVEIEPPSRDPRVGDIVVYRSPQGSLVVHRVWARRGDFIVTKGDAFTLLDAPVPRARVLGVVTRVGGLVPLSVDGPLSRRLGWLVSFAYPRLAAVARRFRRRKVEPLAEAPLLTESEVVAREEAKKLPVRFRATLESDTLRPFLKKGAVLTVSRRPARKGAIVCLAENGRLVWRRVLAARGSSLLLRSEIAPFADGWFEGALGCVEAKGFAQGLARGIPRLWTSGGWWGHRIWVWSRNLPRWTRSRLRPPSSFRTGLLGPGDADACSRFPNLTKSLKAGEKCLALGIWTGGGELVGRTLLGLHDGAQGFSCDTFVDPAFRGRGGAKALLRAMIEEARKRRLRRVFGYVAAHNLASLRACRHAGLRHGGRWWSDPSDRFAASEKQLQEVEALLD